MCHLTGEKNPPDRDSDLQCTFTCSVPCAPVSMAYAPDPALYCLFFTFVVHSIVLYHSHVSL
jgi:hypothetical protein